MLTQFDLFRLTQEEYAQLHKKFGNLLCFQAWDLKRKNSGNNYLDDIEDIVQEQSIALIRAGVYYKRQTYIESSLQVAQQYVTNSFMRRVVAELATLWGLRTKHGAKKQKFGPHQEQLLERIVRSTVPASEWPDPKKSLIVDSKFVRYAKNITWNQQKSLGKRVSRERGIRCKMVSLSQYDHVAGSEGDE